MQNEPPDVSEVDPLRCQELEAYVKLSLFSNPKARVRLKMQSYSRTQRVVPYSVTYCPSLLSLWKDSVAVKGRHVEAVRCPEGGGRVEKISTSHSHNGAAGDVRNDADTRARNQVYQETGAD